MERSRRILIVDDDRTIRAQLARALSDEYDVETAGSADDARRSFRDARPDLVALDISLSGPPGASEEGLELLRELTRLDPTLVVVMITGSDDRARAERAIADGAFDYFIKPFDLGELRVLLRRALRRQEIERGATSVPDGDGADSAVGGVFGGCSKMREVFRSVREAAPTDAGVLFVGEAGTGKMKLARALHELGHRRGRPFVTYPLRGVDEETLARPPGFPGNGGSLADAFDRADGGAVYLEHLDALSERGQQAVLTGLARLSVRRADSGTRVRVLASAERELSSDVESGRFSSRLYHRIAVVPVVVPPLRERGEDVLAIARALLEQYGREGRRHPVGFTRDAEAAMMEHDWPGNLPELESRVHRGALLARGRLISPGDLDLGNGERAARLSLSEARHALEEEMVERALRESRGNVSRAARSIGVSRPTFYDLVRKYGIDLAAFKEAARRAG